MWLKIRSNFNDSLEIKKFKFKFEYIEFKEDIKFSNGS